MVDRTGLVCLQCGKPHDGAFAVAAHCDRCRETTMLGTYEQHKRHRKGEVHQ